MFSSKLKEENVRIRAARASGREETLDVAMQENTVDDDEGSIVTELKKGHNSCGACRTRESETWWKAPKGLPTNVLCDHCGLSWRKYADLNVRPIREEPVPKLNPETRITPFLSSVFSELEGEASFERREATSGAKPGS